MYEYILFDLDGTLTDPKLGICTCVQYALKDQGIIEDNLDKLEPFIGPPLKQSFQDFYGMSDEESQKALEKYRERFQTIGLYENKIYPGIQKMLKRLKESERRLAVASSKPTDFVKKILRYFSIDQYFDVIVGSELNGRRVKKEEVVEEALKQLFKGNPIDYDKIVMVGDRKFDIEGAKQFHIDSVGVSYGYAQGTELADAGATFIADDVKELQHILLYAKQKAGMIHENGQDTYRETLTSSRKIMNLLIPVLLYFLAAAVVMKLIEMLAVIISTRISLDAVLWVENFQPQISVTANGAGMLFGLWLVRKYFFSEIFHQYNGLSLKTGSLISLWFREGIHENKKKGQELLLIGILAVSLPLFLNLVLGYAVEFFPKTDNQQMIGELYSVPVYMQIILYGLISPLAEEVLFRGILYNRIKRYYGKMTGIVMVSVLFGAYHASLITGIYAMICGLAIVLCYEWTGSFLTAFLFHSIANLIMIFITANSILEVMLENYYSVAIFGLLSGIVILYLYRITARKK